jgi:hypothetical protein
MAKQKAERHQESADRELSHIAEQLRPLAVRVSDLIPDPANARMHSEENLAAIKGSLAVYGQRKPIVVNRRTNAVEAGNGTLVAARLLGWEWIAVVYVNDDPTTAAGFSISDNRSAEIATWDKDALEKLLQVVRTDDERLQKMLSGPAEEQGLHFGDPPPAPPEDPGAEIDRAAELLAKWGCKRGDLYVIPSKTAPPPRVVTCPHCNCEQEV